ncbi:phosphoribosylglycinamide formyltransferase [Vagococcus bubulae]|uniref:Phosphoribosylglycinamide formyltransferase n=1 Tax=Vagococcus bubulae TaxID=1977868 RepID=A0A429ZIX1_9ENTE|nr:phosphoribosylglycinamide formyltransferase [Vagococcus bubulae]RST93629.1 phosphoribosylglycinamide formyltransferase [Vagococcus bubulae]
MRFAVFASGNGSNFEAIAKASQNGDIAGTLVCVFCDKKEAYVIERAKKYHIPYFVMEKKTSETKEEYEKNILMMLENEKIDLIILAGYMKIIGPTLLNFYKKRIINLHPSLLPKFPGNKSIKEAYESDDLETGVTIHLVDEGVDTGPIIYQESLLINRSLSLQVFEEKMHQLEHKVLPTIVNQFILGEYENV